jgi:polar amino acid transport system substrate-binding protein
MQCRVSYSHLILAAVLLVVPGLLTAQMKLVVGTDPSFPPLESVDDKGNLVGLDIDIMNAVAREGGFTVTYSREAWNLIFQHLQSGAIDAIISDVTMLDWRKETMDFSTPYYDAIQVLVVPKKTTDVTSLRDMAGKRIGLLQGSVAEFLIQRAATTYWIRPIFYRADPSADLLKGTLDGMIWEETAARVALADPLVAAKMQIAARLPFTEPSAIAVKKGNAKALAAINKGLKAISDSGLLAELIGKWIK